MENKINNNIYSLSIKLIDNYKIYLLLVVSSKVCKSIFPFSLFPFHFIFSFQLLN